MLFLFGSRQQQWNVIAACGSKTFKIKKKERLGEGHTECVTDLD